MIPYYIFMVLFLCTSDVLTSTLGNILATRCYLILLHHVVLLLVDHIQFAVIRLTFNQGDRWTIWQRFWMDHKYTAVIHVNFHKTWSPWEVRLLPLDRFINLNVPK